MNIENNNKGYSQVTRYLFILSIILLIVGFCTGLWCSNHQGMKGEKWTWKTPREEVNRIVGISNQLKLPSFIFGAAGAIGILIFRPKSINPNRLPILGLRLPKQMEMPAKVIAAIEILIILSLIISCIVIWFLHDRGYII